MENVDKYLNSIGDPI